jgi:hypothetical protein
MTCFRLHETSCRDISSIPFFTEIETVAETSEQIASVTGLNEAIQATIANSGPGVIDAVVKHFATIETDKRKTMIIDGVKKHADAVKALEKIKPDHQIFSDDNVLLTNGWTAQRKGEREKAQKLVKKFEDALALALGKMDFKQLEEAVKGGGGQQQQNQGQAKEE